MSILNELVVVATSDDVTIWADAKERIFLYQTPHYTGDGRPPTNADYSPESLNVLGIALDHARKLFRNPDGEVLFNFGSDPRLLRKTSEINSMLARYVIPFTCNRPIQPDQGLEIPQNALSGSMKSMLRAIIRANPDDMRLLRWPGSNYSAVGSIATHARICEGVLSWPLVGLVPDTFVQNYDTPEGLVTEYPRIREMMASYKDHLSPTSMTEYIGFIAGCFDANTLTNPIPILYVDAADVGVGKSQMTDGIGRILCGKNYTQIGFRSDMVAFTETIIANIGGGCMFASIDNVKTKHKASDYGPPPEFDDMQISSATASDRSFAARKKYGIGTTPFPGRIFVMNGVYSQAAIARGLRSRMWCVRMLGDPRALPGAVANKFAAEHREELIVEFYSLISNVKVIGALAASRTRAADFEKIALEAAFTAMPELRGAYSPEESESNVERLGGECRPERPGGVVEVAPPQSYSERGLTDAKVK